MRGTGPAFSPLRLLALLSLGLAPATAVTLPAPDAARGQAPRPRPNIVVITTDDRTVAEPSGMLHTQRLTLGLDAPAAARPVQSHSMIHTCCTPNAEQAYLIAAAKASGATLVRLDVEVHGIVRWSPSGHWYDFSKLDRVVALARKHRIRILGILSGTPADMAACPRGTTPEAAWKCEPSDPDEYARHVVAIMEHAGPGVYAWEFWNEPDLSYMYIGSPEAYGLALAAIYRRSAGRFRITNGGVADLTSGLPFLRRAISAGARFDIGNVHLRGAKLLARAKRAARFFGARPLWITEHGYPSHPDPQAQVRQLRCSLPALRAGGADQVFVTLRDIDEFGPHSPFASEGILGKPAWNLIVRMNRQARLRKETAAARLVERRPRAANRSQDGRPIRRGHWVSTSATPATPQKQMMRGLAQPVVADLAGRRRNAGNRPEPDRAPAYRTYQLAPRSARFQWRSFTAHRGGSTTGPRARKQAAAPGHPSRAELRFAGFPGVTFG